MPVLRSFVRKIQDSYTLFLQIVFVTLVFAMTIVASGLFVNNLLVNYIRREAERMLTQTQIRIMEELREAETLMVPIVKGVRDIIMAGGGADDVQEYYDEISADLLKKEEGFVLDVLHGYFEALGNEYISAPEWTLPGYDATERPWYKAAVEAGGKIITTPIYLSLRSNEYLINFACRIFDDEGEPLGVVAISMTVNNITKFVADMHLAEGGYGFLANENFELIAHHEEEFITRQMNDLGVGFNKIIEKFNHGESFVYIEEVNFQGIYSVFFCERIDNGWYLGIMTPKNIYYRDLNFFMLFLGALGIVMMLVIIIILIHIDAKKNEAQAAIAQMQKAIGEKDKLANLGNILNSLDTMLYVIDPATDEILLVNDVMKRHYGIEGDVTGQICYKILQKDVNEKCGFCPSFQLDLEPDATVVWEKHSALTNRFYRNIDSYIDWPNGKKVHLQQSIDITDLSTMSETLKKRLEQQSLMTNISQSFLANEDMDMLITNALKIVGEFMGIDQILLFITDDNGNSYVCKNEWLSSDSKLPSWVGEILTAHKTFQETFSRIKQKKSLYVTSNDPETRKSFAQYKSFFNNYIITFVFIDDDLYAIIDFSKVGEGKLWNEDEINMACYATNVLFGALRKHSAELQLIDAKEAAEQSNRSKGVFLAQMSHEIRTPMNAILGISEIQLQEKTLLPDTEEAFRQIYDSGNLLLNIINDILDFSKIEAGKLEIIAANYNIPSLINDSVQLNMLRYESLPLEFRLDLDENTPLEMYGDELRIKQILNNLLSNAFKYTDEGEINMSVYAEQEEENEIVTLIFRVSDTGQGMSKEQVAKLFDEYSRFNMEVNRSITGTGLGMSIVRGLVDMMGGEIFVESEIKKGSTFTVRLPQIKNGPAVCGVELAENLRNFRFHSTPTSKKAQIVHEYMPYGSVLVVDDVASNLYVAKGLLTSYGLRIETAASGNEAIEKIKAGSVYDIVFMDHMMPGMDGMEAVKIMRDMGYTRTVVALTANAVVGQAEVFLANGFDGFISKPIDSRELDSVLKRFIRDKQPHEVIDAARREQRKQETGNSAYTAEKVKDVSEIDTFFVLDAENAVRVMEEVYSKLHTSDDKAIGSYTIVVHGMKNVLANIGETELSAVARRLESAGKEQDLEVIKKETPEFVDALRVLIDKYKPVNKDNTVEMSGEDTVYLRDKLLEIKMACEAFDVTAAKEALDELRQKAWPRYVNDTLDEIHVHLLHSAFRKAAASATAGAEIASETVAESAAENTEKM